MEKRVSGTVRAGDVRDRPSKIRFVNFSLAVAAVCYAAARFDSRVNYSRWKKFQLYSDSWGYTAPVKTDDFRGREKG